MGDMAIFYSAKVYFPSQYALGVKEVAGITKVNIGVVAIQNFLKNLTTIGKGYVLLAEDSGLVIGGSINTTALDPSQRLSLFDLSDRDCGELMRDISNKYDGLENIPEDFYISSKGESYLVLNFVYTFMNLKWQVFLVVYESDISRTTNINTGVSVGVAVACSIIGFLMSFLIGYIITSPLVYLQGQFALIKKFELEKVNFKESPFKEVNSILGSLKEMVSWLVSFHSLQYLDTHQTE